MSPHHARGTGAPATLAASVAAACFMLACLRACGGEMLWVDLARALALRGEGDWPATTDVIDAVEARRGGSVAVVAGRMIVRATEHTPSAEDLGSRLMADAEQTLAGVRRIVERVPLPQPP